MKTVTIAIPSLHRPDLTARCLGFLQQQTLPAEQWEIIVVENQAQPGKCFDPLPANARRIELPTNQGTTGSINQAIAASESCYVLLLNNDVELQPDYLEKLVAALDDDFTLGFATGKLLRATDRTLPGWRGRCHAVRRRSLPAGAHGRRSRPIRSHRGRS